MKDDLKPSALTPEQLQQAATELFSGPDMGLKVKGVVMSVEEPRQIAGTSAKGAKYDFIARRIQLSCAGKTVVVSETRDKITDFKPVGMYTVVSYDVESCRMDGPQMVLRVA